SARYGSQNQDVCNMRKSGDASHRHDELYVSCTHTACNIEQKEDKATNNARGKRTQQLPPSAKNKVQHKAEPKRGKCNKVRNPSAPHVKDGGNQRTGRCGRRIGQYGLKKCH